MGSEEGKPGGPRSDILGETGVKGVGHGDENFEEIES